MREGEGKKKGEGERREEKGRKERREDRKDRRGGRKEEKGERETGEMYPLSAPSVLLHHEPPHPCQSNTQFSIQCYSIA